MFRRTRRVLLYRSSSTPPSYWGCARSRGKLIALRPPNPGAAPATLFRVSGNRVLFDGLETYSASPTARTSFFMVYNLGAKRTAIPKTVRSVGCPDSACSVALTDAVLKPNGSAAAIVAKNKERYVLAADKDGVEQVDSSPGIDPTSLQLSGSTASWLRDGTRRGRQLR